MVDNIMTENYGVAWGEIVLIEWCQEGCVRVTWKWDKCNGFFRQMEIERYYAAPFSQTKQRAVESWQSKKQRMRENQHSLFSHITPKNPSLQTQMKRSTFTSTQVAPFWQGELWQASQGPENNTMLPSIQKMACNFFYTKQEQLLNRSSKIFLSIDANETKAFARFSVKSDSSSNLGLLTLRLQFLFQVPHLWFPALRHCWLVKL